MGSKSNISVLAISGKSRNRKIIAPSPHFIINPPPLYGIVPIFPEGHFIMTIPPPHFKIFFRNTPPNIPPSPPPSPVQLSTEVYFLYRTKCLKILS